MDQIDRAIIAEPQADDLTFEGSALFHVVTPASSLRSRLLLDDRRRRGADIDSRHRPVCRAIALDLALDLAQPGVQRSAFADIAEVDDFEVEENVAAASIQLSDEEFTALLDREGRTERVS